MAPTTSSAPSPTELLWAQQLKREHGFLLDRMRKLETEVGKVEASATSAQTASTSNNGNIAALDKRVQALREDRGESEAVDALREEVMKRLGTVTTNVEKIITGLAESQEKQAGLAKQMEGRFQSEKVLLGKVKEAEENLKKYEERLTAMGERVDAGAIELIQEQLDKLIARVKEDGIGMEGLKNSVRVLEEVTKVLKSGNEDLGRELKELAERPIAPVIITQPPAAMEPEPVREAPPKSAPKSTAKAPAKTTAKGKTRAAAASQTVRRAPPPRIKADPITAKPILRAGRGWIEVPRTPSGGSAAAADVAAGQSGEANETPKRGRGGPRKAKVTPSIEQDDKTQKRRPGRPRKNPIAAPRRTIKQQDDTQANPGAKRNAPAAETPAPDQANSQAKRRGLTNIFTSPLSSAASEDELAEMMPPPNHMSGRPAEKKRRIIKQDDDGEDDALLWKFSEV